MLYYIAEVLPIKLQKLIYAWPWLTHVVLNVMKHAPLHFIVHSVYMCMVFCSYFFSVMGEREVTQEVLEEKLTIALTREYANLLGWYITTMH